MNVAYFECFAGISGDMALGALLDAGAEMITIRNAIDKLGVPGLGLHSHRVSKHSVAATAVDVIAAGVDIGEDKAHHDHVHSGRHLSEIVQILENSELDDDDKVTSIQVFERLSAAEARIHGVSVERVHLHEAGAMDAIVDVVGTIVALSSLGISRVYSSRLRLGTGFTTCSHGTLPVPVPAVVELCKDIPCEQTDIAAELGCSARDAAAQLIPGGAIYFLMDEADVQRILAYSHAMVGSDGLPHDKHPHPRLWGTFPRVLGHYARDLGLFTLEDAVRRMTGLSAEQFGLKDRGVLRPGAFADITLFNPETVIDSATFEKPTTPAVGIDMVLVNGEIIREQGRVTGARPGRALKRNGA